MPLQQLDKSGIQKGSRVYSLTILEYTIVQMRCGRYTTIANQPDDRTLVDLLPFGHFNLWQMGVKGCVSVIVFDVNVFTPASFVVAYLADRTRSSCQDRGSLWGSKVNSFVQSLILGDWMLAHTKSRTHLELPFEWLNAGWIIFLLVQDFVCFKDGNFHLLFLLRYCRRL